MTTKPLSILVTNDDGITAAGIAQLVQVGLKFGKVTVVAPDKPQSGMGHAITISSPLRLTSVSIFEEWGVEAFSCSGTPVDCVKLAKDQILHHAPDICLSGINHGSNAAINVIYSGTMSAAMEAAIEGINAIGFSSLNYDPSADLSACAHYAEQIIRQCLERGFPASRLLNVNFPNLPLEAIKGIKICRQAEAKWEQIYEKRYDPFKRPYYWLTGDFANEDTHADSDWTALMQGYVSVVPVQHDLTAYRDVDWLREHWQ